MLRIGARAKINWTLDITGRRADGYHLMDMLMQSVTLADEITLEKTLDGVITLTTGGTPLLPADEHHLAASLSFFCAAISHSNKVLSMRPSRRRMILS